MRIFGWNSRPGRRPADTPARTNPAARPARPRIALERLEDRSTPAVIDLTSHGAFGAANGAVFAQHDQQPTGTGVIDSFVRVQAQGAKQTVEQGYNTDYRKLQLDENSSRQFTRSLRLGDVPTDPSGRYREFLLDVNQKASGALLSLDELRVYVGGSGDLHNYDGAAKTLDGLSAVFDLGDNWVKLDARLNQGSGKGDMVVGIPAHLFAGGDYVYLYSKFGVNHAANGGFEEWAVGRQSVELPAPPVTTGGITGTVTVPGYSGAVTIELIDGNGGTVGSVTTSPDGTFEFPGVPAGTYTVRAVPPTPDFLVTDVEVVVEPGEAVVVDVLIQEGNK